MGGFKRPLENRMVKKDANHATYLKPAHLKLVTFSPRWAMLFNQPLTEYKLFTFNKINLVPPPAA